MKGGFLFIVVIVLGLLSVVLKNKQDDARAEEEARLEAYREQRRKERAEAPKVIKEMTDWIFSPSRIRKSVLEELDETYPTVELEEEPDNPKDPGAIAVMYNDADGNDVHLGYLFKGKLYEAVHEALDNGGKFYASINSVDWDRLENDPKKYLEISVDFTEQKLLSTAAERHIIITEKRSGRSGQGALYGNSYLFLKYQIVELVIVTN